MSQRQIKDIVTLAVIACMIMMEGVDANILNIAIPTMAKSLAISPLNLKLAVTSYLVAIAIFIPISGWVSDNFGTRKTLMVAILGFCFSSFLCGISTNLNSLSLFRFIQGASGAFMVPVARLLLLKAFPKDKMVKMYFFMSITTLLGPLFAPLIGGFIVTRLSWPYIFYVNIPVGIIALIATYYFVGNYKQKSSLFSIKTYLWLAISLASLVFCLNVSMSIYDLNIMIGLMVTFIIAVYFYQKYERRAKRHVVNYSLFKIKTFKYCFMANFLARTAFGGRSFIIALFLQISLQIDPESSGSLIACTAAGLLMSRLTVRYLLPIFGFKKLLTISNLGSGLSFISIILIHQIGMKAVFIFIINGLFTTIGFMLMNLLCYADVNDKEYASATSLNLTVQQVATATGVLLSSDLIKLFNMIFNNSFAHLTFTICFTILALIGMGAQFCFMKLKANDGEHLINKDRSIAH